jgi:hypothetical protein
MDILSLSLSVCRGWVGDAWACARRPALTTGAPAQFADVVWNFGATAVGSDTWLARARQAGARLWCFGDDTWLRLFPTLFDHADGTNSFFVNVRTRTHPSAAACAG